jgi:methylenetetrahydrofolate dehydrogenase (NADP+)/methenyltetrahydrofolate cyclohydrolase
MEILLDGKKVADSVYKKLVLELSLLPSVPKMVVVLVGEDPASETYVRSKTKKCQDLGIHSETKKLPANVSEKDLLSLIDSLNRDKTVHGILVQLPLPNHINKTLVLNSLDPAKDVDGLHPLNAGKLIQGKASVLPCTPAGVIEILKYYSLPIEGKKAVVVGRSEIVGKPMALLLLQENATVTVCHSKTANLAWETEEADILIVALGRKEFIGSEHVKKGAVVIDVGIHRLPPNEATSGKSLCGDVAFTQVQEKVKAITPVPGGVGPMTIAMLMKNVVSVARNQLV